MAGSAAAAPKLDPNMPPIAQTLAGFAHDLRYEDIPEDARERAKHLMLDGIGIAFASHHYPFANTIFAGIHAVAGNGDCPVIGRRERLPLRDSVLMNGALVHGLDYDDTHMNGIVHATAGCFPTAFGAAVHADAHGKDLLTAYVAGMEVAIRIGAAAKGGFHDRGLHPTGLTAHFAGALIAGKLFGLDAAQLAAAQGVVGSTASGSQEFLTEGAWNKRLHPGWGGFAGITAARLCQHGFVAPSLPYEGRFGLFPSYLAGLDVDYAALTADLGSRWETPEMAIKPYPTCHFTHGAIESALKIRETHGIDPAGIARIRAFVPGPTLGIVAEPAASKKRPQSDYEAKFSTQYLMGCCFARGRVGLQELDDEARNDPAILEIAAKTDAEADPRSAYPTYFSGGVAVTLQSGEEFVHHERVNLGAGDRALSNEQIVEKFMDNMALTTDAARAARVRDLVLGLDTAPAKALADGLTQ